MTDHDNIRALGARAGAKTGERAPAGQPRSGDERGGRGRCFHDWAGAAAGCVAIF